MGETRRKISLPAKSKLHKPQSSSVAGVGAIPTEPQTETGVVASDVSEPAALSVPTLTDSPPCVRTPPEADKPKMFASCGLSKERPAAAPNIGQTGPRSHWAAALASGCLQGVLGNGFCLSVITDP